MRKLWSALWCTVPLRQGLEREGGREYACVRDQLQTGESPLFEEGALKALLKMAVLVLMLALGAWTKRWRLP